LFQSQQINRIKTTEAPCQWLTCGSTDQLAPAAFWAKSLRAHGESAREDWDRVIRRKQDQSDRRRSASNANLRPFQQSADTLSDLNCSGLSVCGFIELSGNGQFHDFA